VGQVEAACQDGKAEDEADDDVVDTDVMRAVVVVVVGIANQVVIEMAHCIVDVGVVIHGELFSIPWNCCVETVYCACCVLVACVLVVFSLC